MGILDKVVKLEKKLEKLASRPDAPRTPLEIRRAVLDDVEEHVQPAGRGRRVFPYDTLAIEVLATPSERAAVMAVLDAEEGFAEAIRDRLREAGCERVGTVKVTVRTVTKPRPEWNGQSFHVSYERSAVDGRGQAAGPGRGARSVEPEADARKMEAARGAIAAGERLAAQLVVLQGAATKKAYALSAARTNIGRMAEVTDRGHRVVRRNQVVFLESDAEANQTVSRAQAHITFSPPADFRLFDDHSSYGTRIVRDGKMIELPSGSPRGVKLESGDEIYFGRARVQFLVK